MKLRLIFILVVTVLSSVTFSKCIDPLWLFADSQCTSYSLFTFQDTSMRIDFLVVDPYKVNFDTGESCDGSIYLNFNYQFQSDTFRIIDEYDKEIVRYKDFRPGFAGFAATWDKGTMYFDMARYKYLIFAHKGPAKKHKVTVKWWYIHVSSNTYDGITGATRNFSQPVGTFSSSDTWKLDTIIVPDSIQKLPDGSRNYRQYWRMEFDINNLVSSDTTSGPPGCLKIDNIRLVGRNPIESSPESKTVQEGDTVSFKVKTSRSDTSDLFTYQWNKNGAPITGKNDTVLSLESVKASDAGKYSVTVTVHPSNLSFTSNSAALALNESSGCGSGACLALLPPLFLKAMSGRKRKRIFSKKT